MKLKLLLVLFFFPFLVPAQTVITFLDATTKDPVPDVIVKTSNKNNYISNEMGQLSLDISDTIEVISYHIAYESKPFEVIPDKNTQIFLNKTELSLTEVVVSSLSLIHI